MSWHVPKSKVGKYVVLPVAIGVAAMLVLYLILLAAEAYSAVQASRILNRVEALRLGSPVSDFERAVRPCKIEREDAKFSCILTAGPFRFHAIWTLLWLPEDWALRVQNLLGHPGLRYWDIIFSVCVLDGAIDRVWTRAYVVGKDRALEATWDFSDGPPDPWVFPPQGAGDHRTVIGWYNITNLPGGLGLYNITSLPGGQGFWIHATCASNEKELRARRINRKCLFSFRGCGGLYELLPDVVPVLKERNRM